MILQLYHGTTKEFSQELITKRDPIDRTKGGGELGMGFYLGDNLGMAIIFAKSRYGVDAGVIEFDIDKKEFAKLDLFLVKLRKQVYLKWRTILSKKMRFSYVFNKDVIMAPFATVDICIQYKFESAEAEKLVNKSQKRQIL